MPMALFFRIFWLWRWPAAHFEMQFQRFAAADKSEAHEPARHLLGYVFEHALWIGDGLAID